MSNGMAWARVLSPLRPDLDINTQAASFDRALGISAATPAPLIQPTAIQATAVPQETTSPETVIVEEDTKRQELNVRADKTRVATTTPRPSVSKTEGLLGQTSTTKKTLLGE